MKCNARQTPRPKARSVKAITRAHPEVAEEEEEVKRCKIAVSSKNRKGKEVCGEPPIPRIERGAQTR